jgi:hypothetical protein
MSTQLGISVPAIDVFRLNHSMTFLPDNVVSVKPEFRRRSRLLFSIRAHDALAAALTALRFH